MEINKPQTLDQLAEHFKWHKKTVSRSMEILERSGTIEVNRIFQPYTFKWNGKPPSVWPVFEFKSDTTHELSALRETCNKVVEQANDWKTPNNVPIPHHFILAAVYGMELNEPGYIEQYNLWLDEASKKLRAYYLAYRLIETIKSLSMRERKLERWGIQYKKEEPFIDMALIYRESFQQLLDQLK